MLFSSLFPVLLKGGRMKWLFVAPGHPQQTVVPRCPSFVTRFVRSKSQSKSATNGHDEDESPKYKRHFINLSKKWAPIFIFVSVVIRDWRISVERKLQSVRTYFSGHQKLLFFLSLVPSLCILTSSRGHDDATKSEWKFGRDRVFL